MEQIILRKELITPEMANQILEKNHINRRLRIDDVNAYARDILNGNWKENSDPITISKSGNLLNGQHRFPLFEIVIGSEFSFQFPFNISLA